MTLNEAQKVAVSGALKSLREADEFSRKISLACREQQQRRGQIICPSDQETARLRLSSAGVDLAVVQRRADEAAAQTRAFVDTQIAAINERSSKVTARHKLEIEREATTLRRKPPWHPTWIPSSLQWVASALLETATDIPYPFTIDQPPDTDIETSVTSKAPGNNSVKAYINYSTSNKYGFHVAGISRVQIDFLFDWTTDRPLLVNAAAFVHPTGLYYLDTGWPGGDASLAYSTSLNLLTVSADGEKVNISSSPTDALLYEEVSSDLFDGLGNLVIKEFGDQSILIDNNLSFVDRMETVVCDVQVVLENSALNTAKSLFDFRSEYSEINVPLVFISGFTF